jgi:hypothetical protein
LAPLIGAHNLVGVNDRGGPVEALGECVSHKGLRRRVVAVDG